MNAPPGLSIRLGDQTCEIEYRSPSAVARLLEGRRADEVPRLLASLFAICPAAQSLAGAAAITAAKHGMDKADRREALRAVRLESVREHGLKILLGWSEAMGETPDITSAARLNTLSRTDDTGDIGALRGLVAESVFGEAPSDWLDRATAPGLEIWAEQGGTIAARFLARAAAIPGGGRSERNLVARHCAHPAFASPRWQGLAAFHLARLFDLASLLENFDRACPACPAPKTRLLGPGRAHALIETSRGTLEHAVSIKDDRITSYIIISPTDIAFAQNGFARRWIEHLGERAARDEVAAVIAGVDPCVEYQLGAV